MSTVAVCETARNNRFQTVVEPFLQQKGLPFAQVLSAQDVEQAFADEDALFAQNDIFSTPIVLWAFLAQGLRDGKGAACAAAGARREGHLAVAWPARKAGGWFHLHDARHARQPGSLPAASDPSAGRGAADRAGLCDVIVGDGVHLRSGHRPLRGQGDR